MNELLSPAGSLEAFYAAISNGADAIYLGLDKFSARAYAENFSSSSLKDLLNFAHLRKVKIYVTVNTLIYDEELNDVYSSLEFLASIGVDAVIIQDLAVLHYLTSHYESILPHASTQMGVDDVDAAKLLKELGFKRVVLARETPLPVIKEIKNKANIEVEAFIHGALCVSYSGNCYMSSALGERSGNRGRCAGCCRKYYSLIDLNSKESLGEGYLLSMKDLNTISYIKDMSFIDSFKIEGRMKEPEYVAKVTNTYRKILDKENVDTTLLDKVFNRSYTKGFMNGDTSANITNITKPNNVGYEIGKVIRYHNEAIWIRLSSRLRKGDVISIDSNNIKREINIPITKLYDGNFNVIEESCSTVIVSSKIKVDVGSKVYKVKDVLFNQEILQTLNQKEYKKLPINVEFAGKIGKPLFLKVEFENIKIYSKSSEVSEEAISTPTTKENVASQLNKLNDTPYYISNLSIQLDENVFIPLKAINQLRRNAIQQLNDKRINIEIKKVNNAKTIKPQKLDEFIFPEITVEVSNQEQFEVAKELGIKKIYFQNIVRRNNNTSYKTISDEEVLVNGYGGIKHYLPTNKVVSDSSLNVTNHISAGLLSSLGVNRITLSTEISKSKINTLIKEYIKEYNTYPNFELIVYGRNKIMHSKYCPLKRLGQCGKCKTSSYALKDDYAAFPIVFNDDCTTTLLNSKALNIMDDVIDLKGINYYRLMFTVETKEEAKEIITLFKDKLTNKRKETSFDPNKHTRGHFFNNPL